MVNKSGGGKKSIKTQIKKYGSKAALSAEMSRRVKLRKKIGKGGFYDVETAKAAAAKSAEVRSAKANKAADGEETAGSDQTAA